MPEIPSEANVCHSSGSVTNSYTIQMTGLGEMTKQHLLNVKKISDAHTYKLNSSPEKPEPRNISTYMGTICKCKLGGNLAPCQKSRLTRTFVIPAAL